MPILHGATIPPDSSRLPRRAPRLALVLALVAASLPLLAHPVAAEDAVQAPKPAPTWLSAGHELQADGTELGRLEIPSIGLSATLRSGVAMSVIDQGPAHWKGTSAPGGDGNVVIAGHRTTKTRPFYKVDQLEPGDPIVISDGKSNPAIYVVTETFIVDPGDVWITFETGDPIITLFACHPRGSARHRIVVRGSLVDIARLL